VAADYIDYGRRHLPVAIQDLFLMAGVEGVTFGGLILIGGFSLFKIPTLKRKGGGVGLR
jgi:hypothetical protein